MVCLTLILTITKNTFANETIQPLKKLAKTQEQVEERKKHKLAQDMQNQKTLKLTHQFKASSRLDRLKAKNNIST